jgi:hypothetical protein
MQTSNRIHGPSVAALLAAACLAAARGQVAQGGLAQQIQAAYAPTIMDASGIKVAQAGATLVVKKEGIQANPPKLGYYGNDYENGQVTAGTVSGAVDSLKGKVKDRIKVPWGSHQMATVDKHVDSVALAVDDKAYVLKIEVKPASVDLFIQTCGSCDPAAADPTHHPPLARVSVHFVNGFLTATDLSHVQQAIGEVLAAPDTDSSPDVQAQAQQPVAPAAPAPEHFAAIAPPEPPPAEPAPIGLGQSPDQIVAALGTPEKTVNLGTKQIFLYKNLKITFVDGKVTEVE